MTYTGPAYADCSGYTCTGGSCNVGSASGDEYAFLVLTNGGKDWTLWLSRLYVEQSVSLLGTATLSEAWLAAPNPQGPSAPAVFPSHAFNVDYVSNNPTPPPSDPVIYTAWP